MDLCQSKTKTGPAEKWIIEEGKNAYGRINDFSKKPYEPYAWKSRVAPLSGTQTRGIKFLNNYARSGQPNVFGGVTRRLKEFGDAGAGHVDTERIVDEGGRLGAMADYINPNVDAVLAPTIRQIDEDAARARSRLSGSAASSGAFGDARHGVLERSLNADAGTRVDDATGRAYADAWDNAMAARSADLGRFMAADSENAALREQALGRKATAASGLSAAADAEQARKLGVAQSLLQGGAVQQQTEQNRADAKYAEFLRRSQDPYDKFNLLLASLSGVLGTQPMQTTKPDNSFWSLAGGAARAAWPFG